MLIQLLSPALLLALSVLIHASTLTLLFRRTRRWPVLATSGVFVSTWHMIVIAWWITLAHLVQIELWALFYAWMGIFPDAVSASYFSIVTYTTVGYGDLFPPERWRLLAGVEALTGMLMAGWSAAFFFAVANQWQVRDTKGDGTP